MKRKLLMGIITASMIMTMGMPALAAEVVPEQVQKYGLDTSAYTQQKAVLLENARAYYEANFDVNAYKVANPDLALVFGDDEKAYLEHYLKCGIAEGRRTGKGFDAVAYIINNFDYYMQNGLSSGNTIFNVDQFMTSYPEIAANLNHNPAACLTWYLQYGVMNGLSSCGKFDVVAFAKKYPNAQARTNVTPEQALLAEKVEEANVLIEKMGYDYSIHFYESDSDKVNENIVVSTGMTETEIITPDTELSNPGEETTKPEPSNPGEETTKPEPSNPGEETTKPEPSNPGEETTKPESSNPGTESSKPENQFVVVNNKYPEGTYISKKNELLYGVKGDDKEITTFMGFINSYSINLLEMDSEQLQSYVENLVSQLQVYEVVSARYDDEDYHTQHVVDAYREVDFDKDSLVIKAVREQKRDENGNLVTTPEGYPVYEESMAKNYSIGMNVDTMEEEIYEDGSRSVSVRKYENGMYKDICTKYDANGEQISVSESVYEDITDSYKGMEILDLLGETEIFWSEGKKQFIQVPRANQQKTDFIQLQKEYEIKADGTYMRPLYWGNDFQSALELDKQGNVNFVDWPKNGYTILDPSQYRKPDWNATEPEIALLSEIEEPEMVTEESTEETETSEAEESTEETETPEAEESTEETETSETEESEEEAEPSETEESEEETEPSVAETEEN